MATCPLCRSPLLVTINADLFACSSCSSTISAAGFLAAAQRRLDDRRAQLARQDPPEVKK